MSSGGSVNGSTSGRKRWTDRREQRSPDLYDQWKMEEAAEKRQTPTLSLPHRSATQRPPQGSTVRVLTPDNAAGAHPGPARSFETSSIERSTSPTSPKPRKLVKDRTPRPTSHSSPAGKGLDHFFARSVNKSNGNRADEAAQQQGSSKPPKNLRNRAKTYELQRGKLSPKNTPTRTRDRTGSMDIPPTSSSSGAEYLASVPAETQPPSAPSIKSVGDAGQRSASPTSSNADESGQSSASKASARRILHLMRTLNGRYSGSVLYRPHPTISWMHIYCSIEGENGDLVYEPRPGDGSREMLVAGLKSYRVKPDVDGETPILELSNRYSDSTVNLKLLTQVDFDSWYAALLYWQSLGPKAPDEDRPTSASTAADLQGRIEPPPRTSSARKSRHRKDSAKGEREHKKSSSTSTPREAPVIKIGRMIYWDTGAHTDANGSSGMRPVVQRVLSEGSRRWRRINGQLRENGELKLSSDPDNSLISVVQLSQLSRCAIQRLDASVMDDEYCIAIYPQYTSVPTDTQQGVVRPIFLSLESRVLYEVWFVLLRAFTIPQLYGPRPPSGNGPQNVGGEKDRDVENVLATKTTDMFRMERSLSIRIVEAKMYSPNVSSIDQPFIGYNKNAVASSKSELHGYYAEVLLDNETRGKTSLKFDGAHPLWGESFEFQDLPPVLSSANVVVKRRSADAHAREQHGSRDVHVSAGEQAGGSMGFGYDIVCGRVEIHLQELDGEKELEKWWPVLNSYNHRVGDVLIRARAEESVILMARDYEPLGEVLHRFTNGITLQIAQMVPSPTELKNISDCLLNVFQVSGKVNDWLMALVEEEIDGIQKETSVSKLRFDRRVGSEPIYEPHNSGSPAIDRELVVRDMGKLASNEANLLFRGNTLLTKSLDTHMRRVGKEFLELSIGAKLREINAKDPECEVDPSRVANPQELSGNWRRLLLNTQEVWKAIVAAKSRCPLELRIIFRHIRACAEDRYGDFLRSVIYSSVSGFLFLRFFCPAVLNPQLFGLMKEDVKPRARRAFTLIAKSLQTLSNMASFGAKETWMEPMNAFLTQHRNSFKSLIDDVCYVPSPPTGSTNPSNTAASSPELMSVEVNLSYTTPTTIMARLPPTSREGFPSLPYLIDQARAYAELVQVWLDATHAISAESGEAGSNSKSPAEVLAAIKAAGPDLMIFHEVCTALHKRTQDCLSRAERAERPNSASSFRWEELIDQLQTNSEAKSTDLDDGMAAQFSLDALAQGTPNNHAYAHSDSTPLDWTTVHRPESSSGLSAVHEGLRRAQLQSQGSDTASAISAGNASSAPSSDTEHATALPSYEREVRHRERRKAAKQQIREQVAHASAAARVRGEEREKSNGGSRKLRSPIVSALRKRRDGGAGNASAAAGGGYTNHG